MEAVQRVPAILSFVHAAERGSFAAAARALGVSAAAVSKNVAGLERSLGVRLMQRTTRSLQLTSEGRAFLERARSAIDALDQAVEAVAAQRAEPAGRVRISASNAFGLAYLVPLLPHLAKRYPAIVLEIDFDDRKVDLVRDGYDLALRGGMIEDSSLVLRRICTLHTVLVASPAYLRSHGKPATVAGLAAHRLIAVRFLNGRTAAWSFADGKGDAIEFEPAPAALQVSAPEAAVHAAALGMGIAEVGAHHAWEHLRSGRLKVLLPELHRSGGRELALQYPHRALLAPRVRAVIDFALEKFKDNPALQVTAAELKRYRA